MTFPQDMRLACQLVLSPFMPCLVNHTIESLRVQVPIQYRKQSQRKPPDPLAHRVLPPLFL